MTTEVGAPDLKAQRAIIASASSAGVVDSCLYQIVSVAVRRGEADDVLKSSSGDRCGALPHDRQVGDGETEGCGPKTTEGQQVG